MATSPTASAVTSGGSVPTRSSYSTARYGYRVYVPGTVRSAHVFISAMGVHRPVLGTWYPCTQHGYNAIFGFDSDLWIYPDRLIGRRDETATQHPRDLMMPRAFLFARVDAPRGCPSRWPPQRCSRAAGQQKQAAALRISTVFVFDSFFSLNIP